MNMETSSQSSKQTEELTKMAAYTGSTPTTRLRSNPKHFLTWSATVANNRIQKLSKNFVNNVSKLQNKMERAMPTFHPPTASSPQSCSEQVENDLSEPYKDRETCRISRVHKIPLSSTRNNCEKNELKTGSRLSEGLSCSNCEIDEKDANEERYSGFAPSSSYHRTQGKEIPSSDTTTSATVTTNTTAATAIAISSGARSALIVSSKTGEALGRNNNATGTTTTGPGFPRQIQVQSARIVQSLPIVPSKQDMSTSTTASSPKAHKNLVQTGHYKIPPNPTITAEALKAMIINSPTELNSYRKYDEKPPQPNKYVDTADVKDSLELQAIQHENQSKYNLSCGSSSGTSTSNNNASLSDRCNSPVRMNASFPISSSQWSRTSSLSTYESSNAHNLQMPTSILKNSLTNVDNDCDKRNNNVGCHPGSMSSTNVDEICSQGIENEALTITDHHKPATTVSFSSPVIESSDKVSLLIKAKKSFSKRGKSNKNIQGNVKSSNNDKRSVAFQNPLSGSSSASNRKHASVSAEYPQSQLTVTIFEEEAELRHAPWFQAGIPRDIALEVLKNERIGCFLVRESTTKAGCFALSVRVPKEFNRLGIAHYLILKSGRGYKIKGFTKEFKSLNSLITHHSVMPELLPCPLNLHRYYPQKISRFNSSDFMEPEKLVGFTNFVDCLEKS